MNIEPVEPSARFVLLLEDLDESQASRLFGELDCLAARVRGPCDNGDGSDVALTLAPANHHREALNHFGRKLAGEAGDIDDFTVRTRLRPIDALKQPDKFVRFEIAFGHYQNQAVGVGDAPGQRHWIFRPLSACRCDNERSDGLVALRQELYDWQRHAGAIRRDSPASRDASGLGEAFRAAAQ
jgi:hypothetical protein